jgi:hypothetical protein
LREEGIRRERRLPGGRQGGGEKTRSHEIPWRDGGRLDLDPEKRRNGGREAARLREGWMQRGGGREGDGGSEVEVARPARQMGSRRRRRGRRMRRRRGNFTLGFALFYFYLIFFATLYFGSVLFAL